VFLGILLWLQLLPSCPTDGHITSFWGPRRDPIASNRRRWHKGLDIGAPKGTEVRAIWGGKVTATRPSNRGFGNYVMIQSGDFRILYAHLDQIAVVKGEQVKSGESIGSVGDSGRTTGSHLHVGIWRKERNIDPLPLLQHCFPNESIPSPS